MKNGSKRKKSPNFAIAKRKKLHKTTHQTQKDYDSFSKQGVNFLVYKVDSLMIYDELAAVRKQKGE